MNFASKIKSMMMTGLRFLKFVLLFLFGFMRNAVFLLVLILGCSISSVRVDRSVIIILHIIAALSWIRTVGAVSNSATGRSGESPISVDRCQPWAVSGSISLVPVGPLPFLAIPALIVATAGANAAFPLVVSCIPTIKSETMGNNVSVTAESLLNFRSWRIGSTSWCVKGSWSNIRCTSWGLSWSKSRLLRRIYAILHIETRGCAVNVIGMNRCQPWAIWSSISLVPVRPFPFLSIPALVVTSTSTNAILPLIISSVPAMEPISMVDIVVMAAKSLFDLRKRWFCCVPRSVIRAWFSIFGNVLWITSISWYWSALSMYFSVFFLRTRSDRSMDACFYRRVSTFLFMMMCLLGCFHFEGSRGFKGTLVSHSFRNNRFF